MKETSPLKKEFNIPIENAVATKEKFFVSADLMAKVAPFVERVIYRKSQMPGLNTITIAVAENGAFICRAYQIDSDLAVGYDWDWRTVPLHCAHLDRSFLDAIKGSVGLISIDPQPPGDKAIITATDKNGLTMRTLIPAHASHPFADYPPIPMHGIKRIDSRPLLGFAKAIQAVEPFVATEDGREVLFGVHLRLQDGVAFVEATNGKILAQQKVSDEALADYDGTDRDGSVVLYDRGIVSMKAISKDGFLEREEFRLGWTKEKKLKYPDIFYYVAKLTSGMKLYHRTTLYDKRYPPTSNIINALITDPIVTMRFDSSYISRLKGMEKNAKAPQDNDYVRIYLVKQPNGEFIVRTAHYENGKSFDSEIPVTVHPSVRNSEPKDADFASGVTALMVCRWNLVRCLTLNPTLNIFALDSPLWATSEQGFIEWVLMPVRQVQYYAKP